MTRMPLGILYDVHGNVDALNAVLAEADAAGVDEWLLGGDYCAFGPWPTETLARLRELPNATWLRGNSDRWLVDPPRDPVEPEFTWGALAAAIAELPAADIDDLIGLPTLTELDDVFYCHASPLSDVESFAADPDDAEDERLLAGIEDQQVVFGHSHLQFRRRGPENTDLVNPGSVGLPLDGDRRAAWAIRGDDGEFAFRRTVYDPSRAIARMRELDWGEPVARRLERARRD